MVVGSGVVVVVVVVGVVVGVVGGGDRGKVDHHRGLGRERRGEELGVGSNKVGVVVAVVVVVVVLDVVVVVDSIRLVGNFGGGSVVGERKRGGERLLGKSWGGRREGRGKGGGGEGGLGKKKEKKKGKSLIEGLRMFEKCYRL